MVEMENGMNRVFTALLMLIFLELTGCFEQTQVAQTNGHHYTGVFYSATPMYVAGRLDHSMDLKECGNTPQTACPTNPSMPSNIIVKPASQIPTNDQPTHVDAWIMQGSQGVRWICPLQKMSYGVFSSPSTTDMRQCLENQGRSLQNGPAWLNIRFMQNFGRRIPYIYHATFLKFVGM
jgi:hypothetical protein